MKNFLDKFRSVVMPEIARRLVNSVNQNFRAEGRPETWKKSHRAKRDSGQTLSDTGVLRRSIKAKIDGNKIIVGTNVAYARPLQEGLKVAFSVKPHTRTIRQAFGKKLEKVKVVLVKGHTRNVKMPARPFLMIQDSDIKYFKKIIIKAFNEE